MLNVLLTSQNRAKHEALERVLARYYPEFNITNLKVDSGVSLTPRSDGEALEGCDNRISAALERFGDADLVCALEGLVSTNSCGTFLYGWAAVRFVKENRVGYGCSAKVRIPDDLAREITPRTNLRDLVVERYGSSRTRRIDEIGTNGILTQGAYTRVDEFEDALHCALNCLLNSANKGIKL